MLVPCGQGEDGTGFLPFPLSWVQPKRNGVRLATGFPLPVLSSPRATRVGTGDAPVQLGQSPAVVNSVGETPLPL